MLPVKACFHVTMVLLLYGAAPRQVECASSEVHLKLLSDLMDNYTKPFMRPVDDTTNTVIVGLRFTPVIASLKWTDYRLQWEPADYDDINETTIPLKFEDNQKIWIPELSLYESLDTDFHSFYPDTTSATLTYPGEIHWYSLATTKSYCKIENQWFPFDEQICSLTFTTWLYQTNQQNFRQISDIVVNDTFKKYERPNALWIINIIRPVEVNTSGYECETCNGEKQSYVRYKLKLTRDHSFVFVLELGLPCVVILILMAFIPCMINRNDVDVPTYGLTCVLGTFVYFVYLFDRLPSTGPASLAEIFISLIILAGVIVVGLAVFDKFDQKSPRGPKNDATGKEALSSKRSESSSANIRFAPGNGGEYGQDGHVHENIKMKKIYSGKKGEHTKGTNLKDDNEETPYVEDSTNGAEQDTASTGKQKSSTTDEEGGINRDDHRNTPPNSGTHQQPSTAFSQGNSSEKIRIGTTMLTKLPNLGNTCYIATSLQIFDACGVWEDIHNHGLSVLSVAAPLFARSSRESIPWREFVRNMKQRLPHFDTYSEEDAMEFLLDVFNDRCDSCCRSPCTELDRQFFLHVTYQMRCAMCGKEWCGLKTMFPIVHLSPTEDDHRSSIVSNFEQFMDWKPIDNYRCDDCLIDEVLSSQTVDETPCIVTFSISRWGDISGRKNFVPIEVDKECGIGGYRYKLFALMIHEGKTINSGHYSCLRKIGDGWTCISDDNIHTVGDEIDPRNVCGAVYRKCKDK